MANKIVFFDLETPNKHNDRISSIGIIVENIDTNKVEFSSNILINPETTFDELNMRLTKITPAMVESEPSFPDVWNIIGKYFNDSVLCGHNLVFDLNVLDKTMSYYNIIDRPDKIVYFDTYPKSQSILSLDHYRLNDVAKYFNVPLEQHHNSLQDAAATMGIFNAFDKMEVWNKYDMNCFWFGQQNHTNVRREQKQTQPREVFHSNDCLECADISGKTICVTGSFLCGSRDMIQEKLQSMGAICEKGVTKRTDILIVGGSGSEQWAYGSYGGKIKKALDMQEKGHHIKIIGEKELFNE